LRAEAGAAKEAIRMAEEERKNLAESSAQVKKQLPKPTEVDGGAEDLALENPHASGTNVSMASFVSYQEFDAMRNHLSLLTHVVQGTVERQDTVPKNAPPGNKKTAAKPVTPLKDLLDEKERQQKGTPSTQKAKPTKLADFL